jgi:hypothetical protein
MGPTDTPRSAPLPHALPQRGARQPRHRGQGRQAGSKKARMKARIDYVRVKLPASACRNSPHISTRLCRSNPASAADAPPRTPPSPSPGAQLGREGGERSQGPLRRTARSEKDTRRVGGGEQEIREREQPRPREAVG